MLKFIHRIPLFSVPDRWLNDRRERHRPILLQRSEPRIRRRRHHRPQHPRRIRPIVLIHEIRQTRRLRPPTKPTNRRHLPRLRRIQNNRRNPTETRQIMMNDIRHQPRRHPRINRVPPIPKHRIPSRRRERVPSSHHPPVPADHRPRCTPISRTPIPSTVCHVIPTLSSETTEKIPSPTPV